MRAPKYQPGQVAPTRPVEARLRSANNNGGVFGAVGEGLQQAGQDLSRQAAFQDRLEEQNDDTQARKIVAEKRIALSALQTEYGQLQAGEARERQSEYTERADALRTEALEAAATDRMRRFVEEDMLPVHASTVERMGVHAVQQQRVERKAVFESQREALSVEAINETDPLKRDMLIGDMRNLAFEELEEIGGYDRDNPEHAAIFAAAERSVTSPIHEATLDRQLASPMPDVDGIMTYLDTYGDEMTPDAVSAYLGSMADPLRQRGANSVVDRILDEALGVAPERDAPIAGGEFTFDMPVEGSIPNGGRYDSARDGGARQHRALDISAPTGTPIYTIAPGRVTKVAPMDGASGNWVQVTHDDGTTSTYSHMDSFSVKHGQRVEAGAQLGEVGETGAGTGPHLHLVTRDKNGNRVDPEAVLGRQGQATSGNKYGDTAREWDREAVLAKFNEMAEREKWSPEEREVYRSQLEKRMGREEGLLREKYSDAADEATRFIAQKGDSFTSVSQLPRHIREAMDPTDLAQLDRNLKDAEKARREAIAKESAAAADAEAKWQLEVMMRLEPEKFQDMNLLGLAGTPSLRNYWLKQQEMLQKPAEERNFRSGIQSEINFAKKYNGIEVDDEAFVGLYDAMDGYLRDLDRKPSKKDYADALEHAMQDVPTKKSFLGIAYGSGEMPLYEVDEVPANFRERFLKKVPGAKDAEVLRAYRVWLGRQQ